MTTPFELYREDKEKHESGSPCYIGNMTFLVKRSGIPKAKKAMTEIRERLYGLYPKQEDIDEWRVWAHWLAEHGIVSWEVMQEVDGEEKPLEFTREAARDIFLNDEYMYSLVPLLVSHSLNYENYLHDQAEEDIKEIKKPSTLGSTSRSKKTPSKKRQKKSASGTAASQKKKSSEK